MAELAIIVAAALVAPALVAVAIRIGRVVTIFARCRRKPSVPSLPLRRMASPLASANHRAEINMDPAETDVRYCQACGHATPWHAKYCRTCGALLDEI